MFWRHSLIPSLGFCVISQNCYFFPRTKTRVKIVPYLSDVSNLTNLLKNQARSPPSRLTVRQFLFSEVDNHVPLRDNSLMPTKHRDNYYKIRDILIAKGGTYESYNVEPKHNRGRRATPLEPPLDQRPKLSKPSKPSSTRISPLHPEVDRLLGVVSGDIKKRKPSGRHSRRTREEARAYSRIPHSQRAHRRSYDTITVPPPSAWHSLHPVTFYVLHSGGLRRSSRRTVNRNQTPSYELSVRVNVTKFLQRFTPPETCPDCGAEIKTIYGLPIICPCGD